MNSKKTDNIQKIIAKPPFAFTFENMKKIFLLTICVFALFACVTTKYHEPVPMSQQEISEMKVTERSSGVPMSLGAGKITDCESMQTLGINDCAIILCKQNLTTETKLACDLYLPESANIDASKKAILNMAEYKVVSTSDQIEKSIYTYNKGNKKPLTDYCNLDHVVCYLNKRFFPDNKFGSNTTFENTIHKGTYTLKDKSTLEITVFGKK